MGNTCCSSTETGLIKYEDTVTFIPDIKSAQVIKVYDGDTFTIGAKLDKKQKQFYRFSVRVKGIDCPEMKTKNQDEKEVATIAKERVTELIMNKTVILKNITYDKYGRICANVFFEKDGGVFSLSDVLIAEHLAVEDYGKTKQPPSNWKTYYLEVKNNKFQAPVRKVIK